MENSIDNRQFAFIILGVVLGYGIISLPKNIAEVAGTGSWFSLIISTLLIAIFTYFIVSLNFNFSGQTINDYSCILVGKLFTKIILFIYSVYFIFVFSLTIKRSCEIINLNLLKQTPVGVLSIVLLLLIYYTLTKNIIVIAKICEIYGIVILFVYIIVQLCILFNGDFINIKPLFVYEEIPNYLKAIPTTLFPFLGLEVLLTIPFSKKINNKKVFLSTLSMIVIIGLLYIMQVEACLSVMGKEGIISYKDALFATIRRINIESLQIFQRIDGFFLIAWLMSLFCTSVLECYAATYFLSKLINNEKKTIVSIAIIAATFIFCLFPLATKLEEILTKIIEYTSFITIMLIPSLLFFIMKVKKHAKKI